MSRVQAPSIAPFNLKDYFVSFLEAILLGIIQGVTEFIPVSSSAHLKLAKILLHIEDSQALLVFDLFCHLGTMLATVLFLRKQIFHLFFKTPKELLFYFLALIPLVPFYFLLSDLFRFFSNVHFLGFFWMITGFVLLGTSYYKKTCAFPLPMQKKIKDSLWIGLAQCFALFPGLSRSGLTLSVASLKGWDLPHAVLFSFLLSIPTILGGSFLETLHLLQSPTLFSLSAFHYFLGFIVSFLVGWMAIRFIFSLKERKKIRPFGWYCLTAGILSIIYFYVG
jgi:undecaprenyl-diphosphatase